MSSFLHIIVLTRTRAGITQLLVLFFLKESKLKSASCAVGLFRFLELGVVSWAYGMVEMGIKSMALAFGHSIQKSKTISMSNWEAYYMSESQIFYAAQDAYACVWLLLQLYKR